jgi:uncharacterized protein (TIGR03083 family)
MNTTSTDLRALAPLDRRIAVELGRVEYHRFVEAVRALEPDDWARPTDCEGWTVRDLVGHLAGAMMTASSFRALLREQGEVRRRRKQTGEQEVDAMTAVQIARVADLGIGELVDRMGSLADAAADGRTRVPEPVGRFVRFRVTMGPIDETWRLSYLLGTILTRDTWLHRVADLARATGRDPELDGDHDHRIVADVAAEWARRHGQPVELHLTGPAGGRFVSGERGPAIELDTVEFCRVVSGRAEPTHPILETAVPF